MQSHSSKREHVVRGLAAVPKLNPLARSYPLTRAPSTPNPTDRLFFTAAVQSWFQFERKAHDLVSLKQTRRDYYGCREIDRTALLFKRTKLRCPKTSRTTRNRPKTSRGMTASRRAS